MKRTICAALALVFLLALCACGKTGTGSGSAVGGTSSAENIFEHGRMKVAESKRCRMRTNTSAAATIMQHIFF